MATASVDGLRIGYSLVGPADGVPWVLTPGGRDARGTPGLPSMADALAALGYRVLTWDRPNTGESSVCFEGKTETAMQADVLAGLLRTLGLAPAVLAGGSGGSRVTLLAAARHPDVTRALAAWWIIGGVLGPLATGMHYCEGSIRAAFSSGMAAVADLPAWTSVIAANPANRDAILAQDRTTFVATMERWLTAYAPAPGATVPGMPDVLTRSIAVPALVFRSGTADLAHRRETSEALAGLLPNAELAEPPWGDAEWPERQAARNGGEAGGLFVRWPLLVPQLHEWYRRAVTHG